MGDGFTYFVDKNIVKEAETLKHLTEFKCEGVIKYVDFFRDDSNLYLVTEHIEGMTLEEFVEKSHELIEDKKLNFKVYSKIIKLISWKLLKTLKELQDVHQCCHNDICLENVILGNICFLGNKNGAFDINANNMFVKLIDFGKAKIYTTDAPRKHNKVEHDARSADMWSLGALIYHCMTGKPLVEFEEKEYLELEMNKAYLLTNGSLEYFQSSSLSLLQHLLVFDKKKRFNASKTTQHRFFRKYQIDQNPKIPHLSQSITSATKM